MNAKLQKKPSSLHNGFRNEISTPLMDLKTKYFLKLNEVDHRMKMLVFCAAQKTFGKTRQTKKCLLI